MIRKAKADYFLNETTRYLNKPMKFWKNVESITGVKKAVGLPSYITDNSIKILEKGEMLNCFNNHFVADGSSLEAPKTKDMNIDMDDTGRHLSDPKFTFKPLLICQIKKALKTLDVNKSAGPDRLQPFFF